MNRQVIEKLGQSPDGRQILGVTLSAGGLTARFLNIGAALQDLRIDGWPHGLVLGFADPKQYLINPACFGAIVGPVANRIANGGAVIDGIAHQFDRNTPGGHTLHGGDDGSATRSWDIKGIGPDWVEFRDVLAHMHMGFPGNRQISVRYSLQKHGVLDLAITATTDQPTLMNLAQHSYFTLSNAGQIGGHSLQIAAETYLPLDDDGIPTGQVVGVGGSRLDFRTSRLLVANGPDDDLDQNFCVSEHLVGIRKVATLSGTQSGLTLAVSTTQPGLQIYAGRRLDGTGVVGHHGQPYGAGDGLAMECQHWPDAPNQPAFPPIDLQPGGEYSQHTRFQFSMA